MMESVVKSHVTVLECVGTRCPNRTGNVPELHESIRETRTSAHRRARFVLSS